MKKSVCFLLLTMLATFFILTVAPKQTSAQNITADFSYDSTACLGDTTCFQDLSTSNNGPITQWFWNLGDGATYIVQNPCHTYSFPGIYCVTLIVVNSNADKDTVTHCVTVNILPFISCSSNTNTIQNGDTVQLYSNTSNGLPPYSYVWLPINITTQNAVDYPTSSTCYTAIVTDANGCTDNCQVCVTVDSTAGVNNLFFSNLKFKVYPNPAKNKITVETTENKKFTVKISNSLGKQVIKQSFQKKTEVDVSAYGKGLFLVEVCDEKGVKCHAEKVLIE